MARRPLLEKVYDDLEAARAPRRPPAIEELLVAVRGFGDTSVARLRAAVPAGARLD